MAQTLDEFVEEIKTNIDLFAEEYKKKAETEGEYYPLEFGDDNDGLWREFFFGYLNGGGV